MRYIKLKHRSIAMPENWNELTLEQLLTLAVYGMRKLTVQQLKVSMLLSSMGARVMKKVGDGEYRLRFGLWRRSVTISADEVTALADSYSFIIARRDDTHHIDSQLTRDHFPKLRIGGRGSTARATYWSTSPMSSSYGARPTCSACRQNRSCSPTCWPRCGIRASVSMCRMWSTMHGSSPDCPSPHR